MFENMLDKWKGLNAPELIRSILETAGDRAVIGTSFQKTGLVTIDIACQTGITPRVYTVDTERLFPETYEYITEIEKHYNLHVEVFKPDPEKISEMVAEHGEYLFYQTPKLRHLCCHNRRVVPNEKALETLDIWMTGLRHDQSDYRKGLHQFQRITHDGRRILKVAPLINWTEDDVEEYIKKNNLPVHPLYHKVDEAGEIYKTIGCHTCTVPVLPEQDKRAGRWPWECGDDKKECGIQLTGGAGI